MLVRYLVAVWLFLTIYNQQVDSVRVDNHLGHNPYIRRYDTLDYDPSHLRARRHVTTGLSGASSTLNLNIFSHGREFKLRLRPSRRHSFANNLVEINSEKNTMDVNRLVNFYEGYLADEPDSSQVSGSVIDGVFYGTILSTRSGKYYIESIRKYNTTESRSHSIIYHEQDVDLDRAKLGKFKRAVDERKKKRSTHSMTDHSHHDHLDESCGSTRREVREKMQKEQEELYKERIRKEGVDPYYSYADESLYERLKYTREANTQHSRSGGSSRSKRFSSFQRQQNGPERIKFPNDRTICNLYLRVDPQLHTEIFNNEGGGDMEKTTTFLLFYLNKHVEALNSIYNGLEFFDPNKEKYLVGLQFMIYRTKIITQEQCDNRTGEATLTPEEARLCDKYLDVSNFLNYVSMDNFTDYCLAYTFTARDFADGTLGLAWVAKLSGSVGGVCEKRQTLQGVSKSLNSGIVTVVNYQARVPEAVSQITFAHEIGHNFGSEHDPDGAPCSPGSQHGGNFIMYRRATTGVDKNNRNFSSCSRDQMGPILHALVFSPKFCFKQYTGSLCGNGIVEPGEQCDCGYGSDCKENCCIDASQEINKCMLKPEAQCSPSQGPCCDTKCTFATSSTVCMHSNECLKDVFCSGRNASCPHNNPKYFKPEKTECNSGTQVCRSGVCAGSICEKYEMEQCFLEGDLKDKKQDKAVLCHLACSGKKTDYKCVDSFNIPEMIRFNSSKHGLILKPGSPCVGTQGYCDIFSKCRAVDAEGPLVRLKNLILDPKLILTIREWITTYWWATSLIAIGMIVFMVAFIKICSVHTPSSNPHKPPALKISDTLRRPIKNFPHPHFHHHLTNLSTSGGGGSRSQSSNRPTSGNTTSAGKSSADSRKKRSASTSAQQPSSSRHHVVNEKESKHGKSKVVSSSSKPSSKQTAAAAVETPSSSKTKSATKKSSFLFTKKGKQEGMHYYNSQHPLHPVPHHRSGGSSSAGHSNHANRSSSAHNHSHHNNHNHQSRVKSSESSESKSNRSKSFEPSISSSGSTHPSAQPNLHLLSPPKDNKQSKKTKSPRKMKKSTSSNKIEHVPAVSKVPSAQIVSAKKNKKASSTESSTIDT